MTFYIFLRNKQAKLNNSRIPSFQNLQNTKYVFVGLIPLNLHQIAIILHNNYTRLAEECFYRRKWEENRWY